MADEPSIKPVAEKLGAKAGHRWVLVGVGLEQQAADLQAMGVSTVFRVPKTADAVILRAEAKADLDGLTRLREVIAPAGAVWVFWRKGRPELREDDVRTAAIAQGLVDVKVIRVRRAQRPEAGDSGRAARVRSPGLVGRAVPRGACPLEQPWRGLRGRSDGFCEFGKAIVLDPQIEIADLHVQAAVFAPVHGALSRLAEHFVLVVRDSVISHGIRTCARMGSVALRLTPVKRQRPRPTALP